MGFSLGFFLPASKACRNLGQIVLQNTKNRMFLYIFGEALEALVYVTLYILHIHTCSGVDVYYNAIQGYQLCDVL